MNKLQEVYFDDVFAFVHDKNEYLQLDIFLNINNEFFSVETLEKLDGEVRNFAAYEYLGFRGDVFKNGKRTGLVTSILKSFPGRDDVVSYWMPILHKSAYQILQEKCLDNFRRVVTIGDLLRYRDEYNEKLKQEFYTKDDKKVMTDCQSRKTENSINSFYSALYNYKQKGD